MKRTYKWSFTEESCDGSISLSLNLGSPKPPKPARDVFIRWTVRVGDVRFTTTVRLQDTIMLECPINKQVRFQPIFLDDQGNVGRIDGVPTWGVSDDALAEIRVAADGLSADARSKGQPGAVQVYIDADVDLGPGVKPLRGLADVTFLAGEVTTIVMQGSIVDRDPAWS